MDIGVTFGGDRISRGADTVERAVSEGIEPKGCPIGKKGWQYGTWCINSWRTRCMAFCNIELMRTVVL